MVVSWPRRIKDRGGLREQFTHCIDIAPTILEVAGIPEPVRVDGIEQKPIEGISFAHTFSNAGAEERHTRQYFESFGYYGMYKDGWWASCKPFRIPWDVTQETLSTFAPDVYDPDAQEWELYYLPDDFSQARDIAAENPKKLAEVKAAFWEDAERYNVLPMLGGYSVFFGILPPMVGRTKFNYRSDVQNVASGMIPRLYGHSYSISADLVVPDDGVQGVIVAEADHLGGFALFVDDGVLKHTYSTMGVYVYTQEASEPLPAGEVNVRMEFAADEPKPGTGGQVDAVRQRLGGGQRPNGPHRFVPLQRLRGHGHRPRQRPGRGPQLRGSRALPLHRRDQAGDLRPQAAPHGDGRGARGARGAPARRA